MSTAIAKNLMPEMKLLGMLSAFDKALHDATRDQSSHQQRPSIRCCGGGVRLSAGEKNRLPPDQSRQVHPAPGVRRHRLHRLSLDHRKRRSKSSTACSGCTTPASGTLDRPDRRRQDLHCSGCGPTRLCLRQVGAVHDPHHVAGEPRARTFQRHVPALPRQARQT